MDKEFVILTEIEKNSNITQRELSKKVDLSLGSINLLLNKLAKEGLIKIKQIPMNRVAYMLTPNGMAEKIKKTRNYIRYHYNYINDTKIAMQRELNNLVSEHRNITIILEHDEISELVEQIVKEEKRINCITIDKLKGDVHYMVVLSTDMYNKVKDQYNNVVNLMELL